METDLDIDLRTDLGDVVEQLDRGPPAASFALPANLFLFKQAAAKDYASRAGIRKLIRPDNARAVLEYLPDPGGRTHCILQGDFVLCDLIPAIIHRRGRCEHLHIATLGLSVANADALAVLHERGLVGAITLVCSHYFAQVDKTTTFRDVKNRLAGLATIIVSRSHAKVIGLPTASGDHFVIEGSANLRSSDNTEQMVIFNDAETLAWHRQWMAQLTPHAHG